jgi:NADH-quinone oxidoreductase subunit M
MGTYGFVRFSLPMFPDAVRHPKVVGIMVTPPHIGIVCAMVTLVKKDAKRLIAYSSVSHLGYVMLGIFALNMAGVQGGILR